MDIDILLALQQFRNGIGGGLAEFLSKMTFFGELAVTPVLSRCFIFRSFIRYA